MLFGIMGLVVVGLLLTTATHAADRPNILWIIADDFSPDVGCYGNQDLMTPNIDRLAHDGVRYTAAFSTAPVCSSSRSAFITGVYQTRTGSHHHRTLNKKPLPKPFEPITGLLQRAGYFVTNARSLSKRAGKRDYNFRIEGSPYDAADWSERKDGQPFFAQVQIIEPHRSFATATDPRRDKVLDIPSYYPDHPVIRADWANYLRSVEVLDRKVGDVLQRLEEEGLAKNTVVFFFGDHGRPHYRDKQWLYDGGIRVPLIVRWPKHLKRGEVRDHLVSLIDVSAATVALAGVDIPAWMDGVDMLAVDFDGRDVVYAARDRLGGTLDRVRSARTERFKYIRNFHPDRPYSQLSGYKVLQYPGLTAARVLHDRGQLSGAPAIFWAERRPVEELYDVINDPDEVRNLALDPKHAETLGELRRNLDKWIQQTDDKGQYAEADVTATAAASELWYRNTMKKRGFEPDFDPIAYLKWWEEQLDLR
jgi:uncharacterized sulfatase